MLVFNNWHLETDKYSSKPYRNFDKILKDQEHKKQEQFWSTKLSLREFLALPATYYNFKSGLICYHLYNNVDILWKFPMPSGRQAGGLICSILFLSSCSNTDRPCTKQSIKCHLTYTKDIFTAVHKYYGDYIPLYLCNNALSMHSESPVSIIQPISVTNCKLWWFCCYRLRHRCLF